MLDSVLESLYGVDTALEGISVLPLKEFEEAVIGLLDLIPETKTVRQFMSVRARIGEVRKGKDKSNLSQLQARQLALMNDLRLDENVRVYKKLTGYIIERLTDIILRGKLKDEAMRVRIVDIIERRSRLMFSISTTNPEPEVDEVAGVEYGVVDPALSSDQSAMRDRLKVTSSDYDGQGVGIIVP